ncbi:MAG: hypothetical protein WD871_05465 [Xanthobacteraceae bacterium]
MDDSGSAKTPKKPLREAVRSARIEAAERSAVIVELRDAEAARLEMLNDALEPVFAEIPAEHLEQFDRGLTGGSQPRLWIDMVAHVAMGRDKRTYRLLQDTVHGRRVLAESLDMQPIVAAVTRYVARRLVAREQMIAGMASERPEGGTRIWSKIATLAASRRLLTWLLFLLGIGIGVLATLIAMRAG